MESLKKLDCFICNKDIEEFYNMSSRMVTINHQLMDRIVRQTFGIKALSAGRVVVLNSSVSDFNSIFTSRIFMEPSNAPKILFFFHPWNSSIEILLPLS